MESKRLPLSLPPGLFQAGTKMQAEGRWYDGHLTRFFEKTVRSVGGWRRLVNVNSIVIPPVGGTGESGGEGGAAGGSGAVPRKVVAWSSGGTSAARLMAVGAVGPVSEEEGGPGDGTDDHRHWLTVYREGIAYDVTPEDLEDGYVDNESVPGEEGTLLYKYHTFEYDEFDPRELVVTEELTDVTILVVGPGGVQGAAGGLDAWYGGGGGGGGGECPDPTTGVTLAVGTHVVTLTLAETTFNGVTADKGTNGAAGGNPVSTGAGGAGGAVNTGGSGAQGGDDDTGGGNYLSGGGGGGGGGAGGAGGAGVAGTSNGPRGAMGAAGLGKTISGYGELIDGVYAPGEGSGASVSYGAGGGAPGVVIIRYRVLGNGTATATGGDTETNEE